MIFKADDQVYILRGVGRIGQGQFGKNLDLEFFSEGFPNALYISFIFRCTDKQTNKQTLEHNAISLGGLG